MKKLLLFLLCIMTITSCSDDVIEQATENTPENSSLRAASDLHPLDRSFTIPLWEYVSINPTPKGYKDYYYMTSENNPASSLTVNGTTYLRVRQIGRIFKNNIGYPYDYVPGAGNNWGQPLTIWYSPTAKRHRVVKGAYTSALSTPVTWPDFANNHSACDYYQVGILGYTPNYISVQHRAVYQQSGMLSGETCEHINFDINEIRIGTIYFFIDNYPSPVGSMRTTDWSGINSLGFMYLQ